VIVLVCCSFTYVTAQIYGTGPHRLALLGMQFEIAVSPASLASWLARCWAACGR